MSVSANPPRELRVFRERLYAAFNRRADALFELTDAALSAGAVPLPLNQIPAKRMARSEEIGPLVVYLASPASDLITGETIVIDGGETAR